MLCSFSTARSLLFQALVRGGIAEIALHVVNPLEKPFPQRIIQGFRGKFLHLRGEFVAEGVSGHLVEGKTDDGELLREQPFLREIGQRGKEFALGEVAAGAKNDHHAGRGFLRHFVGAEGWHSVFPSRVRRG